MAILPLADHSPKVVAPFPSPRPSKSGNTNGAIRLVVSNIGEATIFFHFFHLIETTIYKWRGSIRFQVYRYTMVYLVGDFKPNHLETYASRQICMKNSKVWGEFLQIFETTTKQYLLPTLRDHIYCLLKGLVPSKFGFSFQHVATKSYRYDSCCHK